MDNQTNGITDAQKTFITMLIDERISYYKKVLETDTQTASTLQGLAAHETTAYAEEGNIGAEFLLFLKSGMDKLTKTGASNLIEILKEYRGYRFDMVHIGNRLAEKFPKSFERFVNSRENNE